MNFTKKFINELHIFEEKKSQVKNAFCLEENLPDQIFRPDFKWFFFEEFDWALSADCWPVIQQIANDSKDVSVIMAVLDPDPEKYFKKEFGYYNWVDIPTSISQQDYWSLLNEHPENSPADSVLVNSEKIVWLPPSGDWAIFGERSYGICILAMRKRKIFDSWNNIEWAIKTALPNNFENQIVPSEFATYLRLNFK